MVRGPFGIRVQQPTNPESHHLGGVHPSSSPQDNLDWANNIHPFPPMIPLENGMPAALSATVAEEQSIPGDVRMRLAGHLSVIGRDRARLLLSKAITSRRRMCTVNWPIRWTIQVPTSGVC